MSATASRPEGFCFIPLDDKVSVVESCIMILEDTERALQGKRADINYLIGELTDIDVKTAGLMMHLKLSVIALRKELPPETPTTPTVPVVPWTRNAESTALRGDRDLSSQCQEY